MAAYLKWWAVVIGWVPEMAANCSSGRWKVAFLRVGRVAGAVAVAVSVSVTSSSWSSTRTASTTCINDACCSCSNYSKRHRHTLQSTCTIDSNTVSYSRYSRYSRYSSSDSPLPPFPSARLNEAPPRLAPFPFPYPYPYPSPSLPPSHPRTLAPALPQYRFAALPWPTHLPGAYTVWLSSSRHTDTDTVGVGAVVGHLHTQIQNSPLLGTS